MSSDESPYNKPNFEEETTHKLAYYYIEAQKFIKKINLKFPITEQVAPHWKAAEQAWNTNPNDYPAVFPRCPITVGNVRAFYAKCDALCESKTTSIQGLIHGLFAANIGAQYILSVLLFGKPSEYVGRIAQKANIMAVEATVSPEEMRAVHGGQALIPPDTVSPGDVLQYKDFQNVVQTVRIKDHGSSVMKGEYFVVTNIIDEADDDGSGDREVPNDVLTESRWVDQRIGQ